MFDRILATILCIFLSPIMIIIFLIIYGLSGPPAIFSQKRCGINFSKFNIYKFRTMKINKGPLITLVADTRVTKIGFFLRRTKLDELPQIINVVLGHMSLVGPRPEVPEIVSKFPKYFSYLYNNKPGITDINSVIFKEESQVFDVENLKEYANKILPLKYQLSLLNLKNISISNKLLIVFVSILAIINHKLSLYIISRFFLPFNDADLRGKLNSLLSVNIF